MFKVSVESVRFNDGAGTFGSENDFSLNGHGHCFNVGWCGSKNLILDEKHMCHLDEY